MLVEAALAALGVRRDAEPGSLATTSVRLFLGSGDDAVGDVVLTVAGRRLRLAGAGLDGEADADARAAWCRVPAAWLADPRGLRSELLEPVLLFLLTRDGLVPVHAAAFLAGQTAVLLAGPSGAGKSSLARAALDAGLPVLAEDSVYVELEPTLRLWGMAAAIHLFPEDAPAGTGGPLRVRGGRRKLALPIPATCRAASAERAVLCVLDRGDAVALEPISYAAAREALSRLEPGFDLLRAESAEVLEALARSGAWRLTLSSTPAEAVALAARRFGNGEA